MSAVLVVIIFALCLLVIKSVSLNYYVLLSKRTINIYLNRIFPKRFPSPYAISKEQIQLPKSTQITDITLIKGVVKRRLQSDLQEYEVDASGTTYIIVFDYEKLMDESQHVLLPIGKEYQSIEVKDGFDKDLYALVRL